MKPGIAQILEWLQEVKDPEIPVLSLVDLGVITRTEWQGDTLQVDISPTFTGCPAMDYMRSEVEQVLTQHGITSHEVKISFDIPWSSDLISPRGLEAIKQFGLAIPTQKMWQSDIEVLEAVACPNCGSYDTAMKSLFGPTLCRSLYHCNTCKQGFEKFKEV